MKRFLALVLMLVLLLQCAQAVTLYDTGLDADSLTRLGADKEGKFSVGNIRVGALEGAFYDKLGSYSGTGLVCFYVKLEGNLETGISYPVLEILYGGSKLNVSAVSIAVNGMRYDMAAAVQADTVSRMNVERISVFLDETGLQLISELKNADSADIALFGTDKYTQSAVLSELGYENARAELAGKSLLALDLPEGAPEFEAYPFYELAKGMYVKKTGIEPRISVSELAAECEIGLDSTYGMVISGTDEVKALTEKLSNAGFIAGCAGTSVNDYLRSAVRSAQRYYGLIETGYADAELISLLGSEYQAIEEAAAFAGYDTSLGELGLSLNRAWFAKCFETKLPGGGRTPADGDDLLLIIDGQAFNGSSKSISLSWDLTADVVIDGAYTFETDVYAETSKGTALSVTMGQLSKNRVIITCELPAYLADEEHEIVLKLAFGTNEIELPIVK